MTLIGINPFKNEDINIDGVVFTLRPLPYGIKLTISNDLMPYQIKLSKLQSKIEDIENDKIEDKEKLDDMSDEDFRDLSKCATKLSEANYKMLQYQLIGWSNYNEEVKKTDKDGKVVIKKIPIEFKTIEVTINNKVYTIPDIELIMSLFEIEDTNGNVVGHRLLGAEVKRNIVPDDNKAEPGKVKNPKRGRPKKKTVSPS